MQVIPIFNQKEFVEPPQFLLFVKQPAVILVVRQILLVRNHRQDFLHAKKRNPSYD